MILTIYTTLFIYSLTALPRASIAQNCPTSYWFPGNCTPQSLNCLYTAFWQYNPSTNAITFVVANFKSTASDFWTGIGFNSLQQVSGSRMILSYIRANGSNAVGDFTATSNTTFDSVSPQTSLLVTQEWSTSGMVSSTFSRLLNSGVANDFQFTNGSCYYFVFPTDGFPLGSDGSVQPPAIDPQISAEPICICIFNASSTPALAATTTQPLNVSYAPVSLSGYTDINANCLGSDLLTSALFTTTIQSCESLCQSFSSCVGFVWETPQFSYIGPGNCYPKNSTCSSTQLSMVGDPSVTYYVANPSCTTTSYLYPSGCTPNSNCLYSATWSLDTRVSTVPSLLFDITTWKSTNTDFWTGIGFSRTNSLNSTWEADLSYMRADSSVDVGEFLFNGPTNHTRSSTQNLSLVSQWWIPNQVESTFLRPVHQGDNVSSDQTFNFDSECFFFVFPIDGFPLDSAGNVLPYNVAPQMSGSQICVCPANQSTLTTAAVSTNCSQTAMKSINTCYQYTLQPYVLQVINWPSSNGAMTDLSSAARSHMCTAYSSFQSCALPYLSACSTLSVVTNAQNVFGYLCGTALTVFNQNSACLESFFNSTNQSWAYCNYLAQETAIFDVNMTADESCNHFKDAVSCVNPLLSNACGSDMANAVMQFANRVGSTYKNCQWAQCSDNSTLCPYAQTCPSNRQCACATVCPLNSVPVCGSNGVMYLNVCWMHMAGCQLGTWIIQRPAIFCGIYALNPNCTDLVLEASLQCSTQLYYSLYLSYLYLSNSISTLTASSLNTSCSLYRQYQQCQKLLNCVFDQSSVVDQYFEYICSPNGTINILSHQTCWSSLNADATVQSNCNAAILHSQLVAMPYSAMPYYTSVDTAMFISNLDMFCTALESASNCAQPRAAAVCDASSQASFGRIAEGNLRLFHANCSNETTAANPCLPSPCLNGGICISSNQSFTCLCPMGFTGSVCQTSNSSNFCSSSPCLNGGVCFSGLTNYTCMCPPAYTGSNCQMNNSHVCASSNACQNGGTCIFSNTMSAGYVCFCRSGYSGTYCQNSSTGVTNYCYSAPCLNGGTCLDSQTGYMCVCVYGFTGVNCQVNTTNVCSSSPCGPGTCILSNTMASGYVCSCPAGVTGTHCQGLMNSCSSSPCSNGGTCSNTTTGYLCTCPTGFSGTTCQITNVAAAAYCSSSPCLNGATCLNGVFNYSCLCPQGFTGVQCQIGSSVVVTNPCASAPCLNFGVCSLDSSQTSGFRCVCTSGFSGKNCQTAATSLVVAAQAPVAGTVNSSSSACSSSPCRNDGSCLQGSNATLYRCLCSYGYEGKNCQMKRTSASSCSPNPCSTASSSCSVVSGFAYCQIAG